MCVSGYYVNVRGLTRFRYVFALDVQRVRKVGNEHWNIKLVLINL